MKGADQLRSQGSSWQFSVAALFLVTTYVAVLAFALTVHAGLGVLFLVMSALTVVRMRACIQHHHAVSFAPASAWRYAQYFASSFIHLMAILGAGGLAFSATNDALAIIESRDWGGSAGLTAALAVVGFCIFNTWPPSSMKNTGSVANPER